VKTQAKKVKDCKVRLTVEVGADVIDARYRAVLQDFQKEANLPGFRQGKAPVEMVEKKYAKEAEEETVKSLVPEVYHRAVVSEKLQPVALPSISEIEFERGKKLSFVAEFETAPEFTLKNYKGLKLKKIDAAVADEDVEKGVTSLLESRAELVPIVEPRAIKQGDFLLSDVEIWKDGQYIPGKKGVLLYAEPNEGDDFYDKIIGAQVDEVREISVEMSPEEKAQGLVGRKPLYRVAVRAIQEKRLPKLDEEFAKNFGMGSVDALRTAVKTDIERHKAGESHEKQKGELFDALLSLATFPLPDGLVEKQEERLVEQSRTQMQRMGIPPARMDAELENIKQDAGRKAAEQVKLYFILQKVADEEGIEVQETELDQRLEALAEESKRPMDEVRQVFEDDLRESMREKATIDFLLANAKFDETKS